MSGRSGNEAEGWAEEILLRQGYYLHKTAHTGSFRGGRWVSHNNDVFGCVDIIAKKAGERTRWIQVTKTGGIGRKIADMEEVPWDLNYDSPEVWLWKGVKAGKGVSRSLWHSKRFFQVRRMDDKWELDRKWEEREYLDPAHAPSASE